jgi:hypothetical protein
MTPIHFVPADNYDINVFRSGRHIIILDRFDQEVTEQYSVTEEPNMVLVKKLQ